MGPREGKGYGRVPEAAVRETSQVAADLNVGGFLTYLYNGHSGGGGKGGGVGGVGLHGHQSRGTGGAGPSQ